MSGTPLRKCCLSGVPYCPRARQRIRRRIRERRQRGGAAFDDEIFGEECGVGCSKGSDDAYVSVHVEDNRSLEAGQGSDALTRDGIDGVVGENGVNGVSVEQKSLWQTTARLNPEVRVRL